MPKADLFCQHSQHDIGRLACLNYQDVFAKDGLLKRYCGGCPSMVNRADSRREHRRKLISGRKGTPAPLRGEGWAGVKP